MAAVFSSWMRSAQKKFRGSTKVWNQSTGSFKGRVLMRKLQPRRNLKRRVTTSSDIDSTDVGINDDGGDVSPRLSNQVWRSHNGKKILSWPPPSEPTLGNSAAVVGRNFEQQAVELRAVSQQRIDLLTIDDHQKRFKRLFIYSIACFDKLQSHFVTTGCLWQVAKATRSSANLKISFLNTFSSTRRWHWIITIQIPTLA